MSWHPAGHQPAMEWDDFGDFPGMGDFPADPENIDPELMQQYLDEEDYMEQYYGEYGEYPDDYDNYPGYYDDEYTRITISELLDRCIIPTLGQAIHTIYPLFGLCLAVRISVYLTTEILQGAWGFSRQLCHLTSVVCGIWVLHLFFEENLLFVVMLAILSYVLLYVTHCKCRGWSGMAVSVVTVVYLLSCELLVVKQSEWHRIRGAQMVLAMKIISVAFDVDSNIINHMPDVWEYGGYALGPGTVIFGPWVSFNDYCSTLQYKKMDFYWVAKVVKSLIATFMCITISTCIVHWLILDGAAIWLLAYRDAQSFRFSHYFVSYLSEVTAVLSGLGAIKSNGDVRWELSVARCFNVEFPRSLVDVVTNWNLPMHGWLKNYVFKNAKPFGNFTAIILTYAASSILHGVNFQLSAVLLSLGFYSYVEYVLRQRLSRVFDACLTAKKCKADCEHTHKGGEVYVTAVNLGLTILAMFHLAYLGLMFDSSSDEDTGYEMWHTLGKWSALNFASHWTAFATYIFYLLI